MDAAELVRSLRPRLTDALIALDFDGTLSPIVPDPEDSRAVDGTVDVLTALTRAGAQVAVITGRAADTVVRLGGLDAVPGILVAGIYGIETWRDGAVSAPETPDAVRALRSQLPRATAGAHPAVWIETSGSRSWCTPARPPTPRRSCRGCARRSTSWPHDSGSRCTRAAACWSCGCRAMTRAPRCGVWPRGGAPCCSPATISADVPAFREIQRLRGLGVAALGIGVRLTGVSEVLDVADATVAEPADLVAVLQELLG